MLLVVGGRRLLKITRLISIGRTASVSQFPKKIALHADKVSSSQQIDDTLKIKNYVNLICTYAMNKIDNESPVNIDEDNKQIQVLSKFLMERLNQLEMGDFISFLSSISCISVNIHEGEWISISEMVNKHLFQFSPSDLCVLLITFNKMDRKYLIENYITKYLRKKGLTNFEPCDIGILMKFFL